MLYNLMKLDLFARVLLVSNVGDRFKEEILIIFPFKVDTKTSFSTKSIEVTFESSSLALK